MILKMYNLHHPMDSIHVDQFFSNNHEHHHTHNTPYVSDIFLPFSCNDKN